MKFLLPIFLLPLGQVWAQDIAPKDNERDPVLSALLDGSTTEEVEELTEDESEADPVLVTGNPPDDLELTNEVTPDEPAQPRDEVLEAIEKQLLEEETRNAANAGGVRVEVEPGATSGSLPTEDIKLVAPFPAKPLSDPPAGWRLIHPESTPPVSETVTLANGSSIALSIRPHVLVPDADGSRVFALTEPGFDPELGYAQTDTIGSVLADSINQMDRHGDRLDAASQRLSELLDSLPVAAADATEADEPTAETP